LEFIARFGVVPRSAVAAWAGTRRTVTIARERRLREAGLIVVSTAYGSGERLALCSAAGLRACGRGELRAARASPGAVRHEAAVARLAALLERGGESILSEREILARERAEGKRAFSAMLAGGRYHRADMVRVDERGGPGEAIEVELTTKGAARLDELLRAWRRAVAERRLTRVVYRCAPRTRPYVEQSIARTRTQEAISVQELAP
jgi:hypothetical protein